jgi:hypothetical protein
MLRIGVIGYGYWGPKLVRIMEAATESMVKHGDQVLLEL